MSQSDKDGGLELPAGKAELGNAALRQVDQTAVDVPQGGAQERKEHLLPQVGGHAHQGNACEQVSRLSIGGGEENDQADPDRKEEQLRSPVVAGRPEGIVREPRRQRPDFLMARLPAEGPPVRRHELAQVGRDRSARALPLIGRSLTRAGMEITRNADSQPKAIIPWHTFGRTLLGSRASSSQEGAC